MVIPSVLYVNNNHLTGYLRCQALKTLDTDVKYLSESYAIEKAIRWMKSHAGVDDALSAEMIEDFKQYMKNMEG